MSIHLDFEIFSTVNLKKQGLRNYATDPSTEIICLAYKSDDSPTQLWHPPKHFIYSDYAIPTVLSNAILRHEKFHAFNAQFEREIWEAICVEKYNWPAILPSQWVCSQAEAAMDNLPRRLDKACQWINAKNQKDSDGHKTMLQVCKPNKKGEQCTDPDKIKHTYSYCKQDVDAEVELADYCNVLPDKERRMWLLDQKINRRGVPIDTALCNGAVKILDKAASEAKLACTEATGGIITAPTQRQRVLDFCVDQGCKVFDTQAPTVKWALDGGTPLTDDVRTVLQAVQDCGLASVKKFKAALRFVNKDGRARYEFKYGQAGPGRWGGSGIQLQNLKRPDEEPTDELIEAVRRGDYAYVKKQGRPYHVLANCVRSIPRCRPGKAFVGSDFAGIENRTLHWLADDNETLDVFRTGADLYVELATEIFGKPASEITKEERQMGKIAVLGLGYCMGANGFVNNCANWGVTITKEFAESVVSVYREKFIRVAALWRNLEMSAMACVRTGKPMSGSKWSFRMEGDFLCMVLPSGRAVRYFKPEIRLNKWKRKEISYLGPTHRTALSRPILVENLTQATARDLLVEAMLRLEDEGVFTVAHVHDSVYCEINEGDNLTADLVHDTMEVVPKWAKGLPIKADTKVTPIMG